MEHDSRDGGVRVKQEARTEFPVNARIHYLYIKSLDPGMRRGDERGSRNEETEMRADAN